MQSISRRGLAVACLNPCFCGIYSQRKRNSYVIKKRSNVLILVFVEFTLRDKDRVFIDSDLSGLNPCFCGIYSQSYLKYVVTHADE